MATEILQMAVSAASLDVSNPLVTFGGAKGARNAKLDIPLTYKDGRLPTPFRSGGYDARLAADGLIGEPRTCKVSFDELLSAPGMTTTTYRAVYDRYAAAIGDGRVVGLVFRTAEGTQRLRYGRLLSMPWKSDESTPILAHMEMEFAVSFYATDLYPVGTHFYDSGSSFTYDDGFTYDVAGISLPITTTTQSITYTATNQTAVVVDATVQVMGPMTGPIGVANYYSEPGSTAQSLSSSFAINDTLIVNGNGYIDYYLVDSGTQTVTKDGVETFDQAKFVVAPGQNDWLTIGPGANTLVVTCPGTGLAAASAVYLNYYVHYL